MSEMEWEKLLSTERLQSNGEVAPEPEDSGESLPDSKFRTAYERDWDRIVFSASFRRMQDKTQVFPMAADDFVHTRLTHSLEVASVGRSLGHEVGELLLEKSALPKGLIPRDLAQITANACLAHDIGNPPFGHAGEKAIAEFFSHESPLHQELAGALEDHELREFMAFEGNAQGLRILTRLEHEAGSGLKLTLATLGAFLKYPRTIQGQVWKKHGVNRSEAAIFNTVRDRLGLVKIKDETFCRHPLAYMMEAADDICYSVLDIEDGYRLGIVRDETPGGPWESLVTLARQSPKFDESRFKGMGGRSEKAGYVRSMAIASLVRAATEAFRTNYDAIMNGNFGIDSLVEKSSQAAAHDKLLVAAREHLYTAPAVLEAEIAGHAVLKGLLDILLPAALAGSEKAAKAKGDRAMRAFRLLRGESRFVTEEPKYHRILRVTDYVSGMTDRYALLLFRKLTATAMQGRFA